MSTIPDIDIIATVRQWMVKATQLNEHREINVRRSAFQLGMQCEELAEKLAVVFGEQAGIVVSMSKVATTLKNGTFDDAIERAIERDPKGFLDGDIDLLWVTAGALAAQGADGHGAFGEVDRTNWAKYPNGVVTLDADGKVVKPAGWQKPNLTPYTYAGWKARNADEPQVALFVGDENTEGRV